MEAISRDRVPRFEKGSRSRRDCRANLAEATRDER